MDNIDDNNIDKGIDKEGYHSSHVPSDKDIDRIPTRISRRTTPHQRQVEWRRNKIFSLLVKGLNTYEIVEILKISRQTVSRDCEYLKQVAKEELRSHIEDKIPANYKLCIEGISEVLKESWKIVDASKANEDNKIRLQALALINDCYRFRMELLTNAQLIRDSMCFVENRKKALDRLVSAAASSMTGELAETAILNDKQSEKLKHHYY